MIFKCHLDVGFTDTQANVLQMYFKKYYPQAIETAATGHTSMGSGRADTLTHSQSISGAAETGSPHLVASGPARLDVGVFDGTHGWLRIRAELGPDGGVNASLTGSAAAHESLRAALPEMEHYLGSEAVSVAGIAVHRFSDESATRSAVTTEGGQQTDAQGQRSNGGQTQDDGNTRGEHSSATGQSATPSASAIASSATALEAGGAGDQMQGSARVPPQPLWSPGGAGGMSGGWLSVRA